MRRRRGAGGRALGYVRGVPSAVGILKERRGTSIALKFARVHDVARTRDVRTLYALTHLNVRWRGPRSHARSFAASACRVSRPRCNGAPGRGAAAGCAVSGRACFSRSSESGCRTARPARWPRRSRRRETAPRADRRTRGRAARRRSARATAPAPPRARAAAAPTPPPGGGSTTSPSSIGSAPPCAAGCTSSSGTCTRSLRSTSPSARRWSTCTARARSCSASASSPLTDSIRTNACARARRRWR